MNKFLSIAKELAILTVAIAIIAVAVFFFLVPSGASISSIAGLAIVLSKLTPLSVSIWELILNAFLLIIGFFTVSKEFGYKTVYTTLLLPVFLFILEKVLPDFESLTGMPFLDAICYIFIVSVGLSILFTRNASSGGLDIVAMILHKYLHADIGKSMSIAGMIIACSSILVSGWDIVVISILGTYINGLVLDHFIFDRDLKRRVCIVSEKMDEVRDFIIYDLHSGASVYEMYGAYKMEKHYELITILNNKEYQKFIAFMNKTDPHAFITVYKVSGMHYQLKPNIPKPVGIDKTMSNFVAQENKKDCQTEEK